MANLELVQGLTKGGMKAAEASSRDVYYVPIDNLVVLDKFNVRTEDEDYKEHVEFVGKSILEHGFRPAKALAVFVHDLGGGKTEIVVTDGHTRLRGAKWANEQGAQIETLPCIAAAKGTSMEDLTVALVTDNSGKPLTVLEKSEVIKRLQGYGWEPPKIAAKLNITIGTVNNALTLAGAPAAVRKMVKTGAVSASSAVSAVRKHGSEAVETLETAVQAAADAGKSKATAKQISPGKTPDAGRKLAKALLKVERDMPNFDWPSAMKACFETAAALA